MLHATDYVAPGACWEILFASELKMAGVRDRESIRNEVRACIREELNNSQGTQTLVNRTRNLIRESASFAARNLFDSEVFNLCLRIKIPSRSDPCQVIP